MTSFKGILFLEISFYERTDRYDKELVFSVCECILFRYVSYGN